MASARDRRRHAHQREVALHDSGSSPAVSIVWAMASRPPADVLGEREGARTGPVDVRPLQVARQLLDLAVAERRDAPADHQAAAVLRAMPNRTVRCSALTNAARRWPCSLMPRPRARSGTSSSKPSG